MPKSSKRRDGFTLVELLSVIAVIAILATLLITVVGRVRTSAETSQCAANLRQLGAAGLMWIQDRQGKMPDEQGWRGPNGVMQYLDLRQETQNVDMPSVVSCPVALEFVPENRRMLWDLCYSINGYICATTGNQNVAQFTPERQVQNIYQVTEPSKTSFFMDGSFTSTGEVVRSVHAFLTETWTDELPGRRGIFVGHNGALNVVYMDGHVENLSREELPVAAEMSEDAIPNRMDPFWGGVR